MRAEYVTGQRAELVAAFMTETTGAENFAPGMYTAFAVLNDSNEFVAGVIVSNFRGTDCEISCASYTPAAWRPNVCKAVFGYIFDQLKCVRCTSITTKRNVKARRFLEHFNFALEGNLRRGYDGKRDALIYGLLADDCAFIERAGGPNGEEIGTGAAART